jgi:hypothetical protein
MHIGVNDLAIKEQGLLLEQGIEVAPWKEFLGNLPACEIVHFGRFCRKFSFGMSLAYDLPLR